MSTFAEWEAAMRFPTVQAAADALGVTRRHVHRLRNGKPPSATLRKLMDALAREGRQEESPADLAKRLRDELERQAACGSLGGPYVFGTAEDLQFFDIEGGINLVALAGVTTTCRGGHRWVDVTTRSNSWRDLVCSSCGAREDRQENEI